MSPAGIGSGNVSTLSPLLAAHGLSHAFGTTRVLDGVSFELGRGELFGLLGPNGSGKSTCLRILTGLLLPDAGELTLHGMRVEPGARALRSRMGVVFQAASLDQRLRVRENLELCARLHRLPASLASERIADALELAQLSDRSSDLVSNLSGGMKRRLELARALLHQPELLLLDEPTSGLDEGSFRRIWARIQSLRANGKLSALLTTHRADEAALCDRVAVMDQGRIVASGTPQALIDSVAGDVLTLEADEPEQLIAQLHERFAQDAKLIEGKVVLERERGHELIPRLIEALPPGRIRSLSMHRPTLADVFVKLTGRSLAQDQESAQPSTATKAANKKAGARGQA